jgi:gamma-glutamyltranspeptidase/glutathione hydrolase
MEERGGLVTTEDLMAYEARWGDPVEVEFRGYRVKTRAGLSDFPAALRRLDELRGLSEPERVLAFAAALLDEPPAQYGTTNITAIDEDGNACVLTTSLGLGSGDFVPGFDLHLNSMLGEADLLTGSPEPGERMASMMAPTIALRSGARAEPTRPSVRRRRVGASGDGVALAVGAAGGTRLRSALLQVVAGILDEGLAPQTAVDRPRLHPVASLVHLEPGFGPETTGALESAGFEVRTWPDRHHYFGGVSALTPNGAAGDPRRNGEARVV